MIFINRQYSIPASAIPAIPEDTAVSETPDDPFPGQPADDTFEEKSDFTANVDRAVKSRSKLPRSPSVYYQEQFSFLGCSESKSRNASSISSPER